MWVVEVTPEARQAIAEFDGPLKDELIERVAEFADEPAEHLRRSRPPELPGLWVYEYASAVSEGLAVVLLFDRFDARRRRIVLVGIGRVMGEEDDRDGW